MSQRVFYKTIIEVTVLSEEPLQPMSLGELSYETMEGELSAQMETKEEIPITSLEAAIALKEQGSDPEFFQLDDEGLVKSPERTEFLNDVFTTALEGGIGYWAYAEEYENNSDDYFAVVVDAEDENAFDKSTINQETIVKGINKIMNDETLKISQDLRQHITEASRTNDASNIDAGDANSIVQVGLFKELVFS